ncbi:hypothetical protein AB1Y20_003949 [Prymnesium parvum]|uniref:DOT1 domain-containing protein n=1 Tax=Prymnesium parvum TaxID=97485 RepID=A0AB34J857_PRYPA
MSFSCRLCFADHRLTLDCALTAVVRSSGSTAAKLERLIRRPRHHLLRGTASRLLAHSGGEECGADVDVLIDLLLGVHESLLLEHLHRAPLRSLRAYDEEHTHLLRPPAESWTPYHECATLLTLVPAGGTLLDLGAGVGRTLLVAALLRPDVRCVGLELVKERVALAQRALLRLRASRTVRVLHRRLGSSRLPLPRAERMTVYLFNPFAPPTLESVLRSLLALSRSCPFTLVLKGMECALEASAAWEGLRAKLRPLPKDEAEQTVLYAQLLQQNIL